MSSDGLRPGESRRELVQTHHLTSPPDVVWFEMQQVLQELRVPVAEGEPSADHAWFVSRPFNPLPDDLICPMTPPGEPSSSRRPVATLSIDLRRWSGTQTEAGFRLQLAGAVVEPLPGRAAEECRSRGTLERRIADRTMRRLRP